MTIQAGDGAVVDERHDPASSFAGHTRQTPWDLFQVVCFASEANWNYLVALFIFTRADFVATEVQPWQRGWSGVAEPAGDLPGRLPGALPTSDLLLR